MTRKAKKVTRKKATGKSNAKTKKTQRGSSRKKASTPKKSAPKKKSAVKKKKSAVKKKSAAKKRVTTKTKRAPSKKRSTAKRVSSTTRKTPARKKTKKKAATWKPKGALSKKIPSKETLIHAYHEMLRARLVDAKIIILYKQNKCHFQIGAAGHEAIQVAAAQSFRAGKDWFYPYYRDMALCCALGMSSADFMLNAMNKADDPSSHGRQMPMHWGSVDLRIVSQSSPTGSQFLQATGCALAIRKLGLDEVVYVSAGEGTCAQGDFHEAINWAAREKLPIVFVIQNNKFAISVPVSDQIAGESVYKISDGYENLDRYEIDGTNFIESHQACSKAHARALAGGGPSLIEAHVPRLQSHSISDNQLKYRDPQDIEDDILHGPILLLRELLLKKKIASKKQLEEIEERLREEIDSAAEWAEEQPDPDPAIVSSHTTSSPNPWAEVQEASPTGDEIYMVDALNHALDEELERNPNMYVYGQDVGGGKGGVFTVTSGLTDKYGTDRVFNGPLAESSLVGVGIGMATLGLKPVVEVQFGDYIWTGMNQIRNELAMMRYRSKSDFTAPLVLRIPIGGYIHGAHYHSQNIEGTFSHFPGLFIALPSNATDAKGMLKAAIRGEDPVLFLEHKGLYRQVFAKGPEGDADDLIPLGKAKTVLEGSDLTIITYGALVHRSVLVAQQLAKEGVSVEVIDLRTIVPLDSEAIFESVRKTNRVVIAHEDVTFMGFGAEIAAQLSESCFEQLDAPIGRVGMKYVAAVPHAPILESVVLPQMEDILAESRKVLSY